MPLRKLLHLGLACTPNARARSQRSPETRRRALINGRVGGQAIVEFTLIVPFVLVLLIGIGDFARLYTTALTVEAAVREGADYGSFQSSNWLPQNRQGTLDEIMQRVCTSASTLPDYQTVDPATNATCTNPAVSIVAPDPGNSDCYAAQLASSATPCSVEVSAQYEFQLIFGGVGVGPFTFPQTVHISRDVTYVVSDTLGT